MPKKKQDKVIDAVVYEKKSTKKTSSKKEKEVVELEVVDTNSTNLEEKPYFFPRLIAYFIDILIVSLVCTGILFLIPQNENYSKYMQEYEQIQADFISENITRDEFLNKSISVVYDIDYNNVIFIILEIVLIILYFIVFQFYNKGQTLGKKLMKLKVVSVKDSNLTLNQVAIHALFINSILIKIFILGSLLFLGRNYYYYTSSTLQSVSAIIVLVTLFMILFRKDGRGLHDVLAGTKVIQNK